MRQSYKFRWDPDKEKRNFQKHKVRFRQASTIFRDPNQLTLYDEEHSDYEDRWITMGIDSQGVLRVVIHTFEQMHNDTVVIRIISARKAVDDERKQYQGV